MNLPGPARARVRSAGIAALLAAALCAGPAMVRADVALDRYNLAIGLYKQSRWALAVQRFEVFLKEHPDHDKVPAAKFYLGLSQINQQDYKAAREVLRNFVKSHPTNASIAQGRYRVAECSYLLDDVKAALPELQEFLTKHPKDPLVERALPYLGDVQLRLGHAEAALATFDKTIEDYPKSALVDDARFGRARTLESLKRDAEAIRQYQELSASADSPRAPEAQFQIAARQFEGKQFADAAAAYRDLLTRFPASPLAPDARLNAGFALYQNGQFADAIRQFADAQEDPQNRVKARYWRGLSLKASGDVSQASLVLAEAGKEAGDLPLAEAIHFQRAICARLLGDGRGARDLFTSGADQWPKGDFADDCLHAAAELAVDQGDIPAATKILTRFAKDYAGSGLRLHQELLQGRVDLALATAAVKAGKPPEDIAASYLHAAEKFGRVLKDSKLPRTQMLARYYLGLTQQLQNQHDDALATLSPLIEAIETDGAKSEFGEALLVQADSLMSLKRLDSAQSAAGKYLTLFPQGRQTPRALFVVAVAGAQQKDSKTSAEALNRLTKDFRTHPLTPAALLQLAEIAETQQDWPTSASRYQELVSVSDGTENQAFALRGLAWAHFKQKQFGPAAEQFDRVVKQFPDHKLASECTYYLAESQREAGQPQQALATYADAFQRFGPETAAAPGAEQEAPLIFAYRAGLQRARTMRQLKEPVQADEAYAALVEKFPKPVHLDRLLDEWALLNYESENFSKADEIFRRLIDETPDSDLADNARLSLAESDLVNENLAEARKAFESLLASRKSDAEVKERSLYQLIVLAVDQHRWADVRLLSERMAQEFPDSQHLVYAQYSEAESILSSPRAAENDLAVAKQKLDAVMKSAGKALAKDAFEGRAWVLSAEIAYREKRYEDVQKLAAELKQAHPDSRFVHQAEEVLGRSFKQQANFPEARAVFERVLNDPAAFRTPTAAKSQFLIAETHFLEEKWEDAFLEYQKVYSSYDHPEWQAAALLQSGKCDEHLKRWQEAAQTYAQLLKEFPKSEHAQEAQQRQVVARQKAGK